MTSTLGQVVLQLITELETTSIEAAYDGTITKKGKYPNASVYIGTLTRTYTDLTQTMDLTGNLVIAIEAKTVEEGRLAVEEVLGLFLPLSTALSTLGVILINPSTAEPPQLSDDSNNIFYAMVECEIKLRYNYMT